MVTYIHSRIKTEDCGISSALLKPLSVPILIVCMVYSIMVVVFRWARNKLMSMKPQPRTCAPPQRITRVLPPDVHYRELEQLRPQGVVGSIFNRARITAPTTTAVNTAGAAPFFFRLPPEIRRQILEEAFGNQTIHLSFELRQRKDAPGASWKWSSRACRSLNSGEPHLPFHMREDSVGLGITQHNMNPISCGGYHLQLLPHRPPRLRPGDCLVGASGWLLSCHQAFVEGLEVLYQSNTIHLDSPTLLRGIHEIMAPEKLALIQSAEIAIDQKHIYHHGLFCSVFLHRHPTHDESGCVFPSLRTLRIITRVNIRGLLNIDRAVERIAPPTAEVTLSCCDWGDYAPIDAALSEKQGTERTRLQKDSTGGTRCWREMTETEPLSEHGGIPRLFHPDPTTNSTRQGYWVQVSAGVVERQYYAYGIDDYRMAVYNLDFGEGQGWESTVSQASTSS